MGNVKILAIKLRRKAFKLFMISIIVIFLIKLLDVQQKNIKKENELQEIKKKTEAKIRENEDLQNKIDSGFTDEFVENFARENLNMSYPNERGFTIIS